MAQPMPVNRRTGAELYWVFQECNVNRFEVSQQEKSSADLLRFRPLLLFQIEVWRILQFRGDI